MPFETTRLSGKLSKVNAQEAMRYLNAVSQDPEGMPEKAPEISSEDTPSEKAKKEQDVAAIKSIKDFCGGALEYTFITNRRGAAVYVFEEKEAKEVKNEKTNETEVIKVTKGLILVFVADVRVLHGTEVLPGSFNLHNPKFGSCRESYLCLAA